MVFRIKEALDKSVAKFFEAHSQQLALNLSGVDFFHNSFKTLYVGAEAQAPLQLQQLSGAYFTGPM